MPNPKMIWDPATGNYVYDDSVDPTQQQPTAAAPPSSTGADAGVPSAGMPSQDALGRAIGILPGENNPQFSAQGTGGTQSAGSLPSNVAADPNSLSQYEQQLLAPDPTPQDAGGQDMSQYGYNPNDPAFGTYDPNWEAAQQSYTMAKNNAENQYATGLQQLQSYYPSQKASLDQSHADQLEMVKNALAQNGLLRSSNYAQAQGREDSQYQNQIDALTQQQQASEGYLTQSKLNAIQNALFGLNQAKGQHAGVLTQASNARNAAYAKALANQQAAIKLAQDAAMKNPLTKPSNTYVPGAGGTQQATTQNPIGIVAPGSPLDYSGQPVGDTSSPNPTYVPGGPGSGPVNAIDPSTGQPVDPAVLAVLLQLGLV